MDENKEKVLVQLFKRFVREECLRIKDQNEYWRGICSKAQSLGLNPVELHEMVKPELGEALREVFISPAEKNKIPAFWTDGKDA